jgi:hypothetical protein
MLQGAASSSADIIQYGESVLSPVLLPMSASA